MKAQRRGVNAVATIALDRFCSSSRLAAMCSSCDAPLVGLEKACNAVNHLNESSDFGVCILCHDNDLESLKETYGDRIPSNSFQTRPKLPSSYKT